MLKLCHFTPKNQSYLVFTYIKTSLKYGLFTPGAIQNAIFVILYIL
jgi:hypothetical protein